MLKEIEVKVTTEDIKNGHRGMCTSCPIARAIRKTLKTINFQDSELNSVVVSVNSNIIKYYCPYPKSIGMIETPQEVARFINCYDTNKGDFGPFKFKVLAPEELIKNC